MVSVCIATFNGEAYIKEQLKSILKQIGENDEVIISDDSSTDNTIKNIIDLNDNRIKIFHNKVKDPIKNFEHALSHATGDLIFLSDQDDIWMENKYSVMLQYLEKYDLVVHDAIITDKNLVPINSSLFNLIKSKKGIIHNLKKSTYYGACMAFKRSILHRSIPFPDTKEIGHDLWIGLVSELTGSVIFINEKLLKYRRHSNTFTPTGYGKTNRSIFSIIKGRLIMLKEIIKFLLKINFI